MPIPLVTIGLPFRNPGKHFVLCIKSLIAQSFRDWVLIAVDDGSTDVSLPFIAGVKDPRIQVVSDGQALGLVHRLNQISSMATTEYLARMDADDIMHPDRLATQCTFLENHRDVNVAGSSAYVINNATEVMGMRRQHELDLRPSSVLRQGMFMHPTVVGRRTWFVQNPYRAEFVRAEDRELWCRTYTTTSFGTIATPLLFYRENEPAVAKYRMSCRTHRAIIRQYGPESIGLPTTLALIAFSAVKETVYRTFSGIGLERTMIQARNTSLSDQELREATNALAVVQQTPLSTVDAKERFIADEVFGSKARPSVKM